MSKKNKGRTDGLVYSTNQDYYNDFEEGPAGETLPKEKQKLRVKLDTKQRAGKVVTLVEGFIGTTEDLEALGKQLKTKCGTGGSAKDGLIIIQGDYKEKILGWLKDWGYSLTK
ncbi:translation initiation factor [Polluticoccus soli]|uniref:translation initiation factor n=1 Tax=Polluticoccus soli TaxID=3034150 RepID=UPI0023E25D53|nr:translation initiation factor [Flavipsychrobacter sp. JY13-12]